MSIAEKEQIRAVLEPILPDHAAYLVELVLRGESGQRVIEVFIDGEKDVTIDQCASVSRRLIHLIDEIPTLKGRYTLTVSSPGLDRPLKLQRQYVKNIGREMRIRWKSEDRTSTLEGTLVKVESSSVVLRTGEGIEKSVLMSDIVEAFVVPHM